MKTTATQRAGWRKLDDDTAFEHHYAIALCDDLDEALGDRDAAVQSLVGLEDALLLTGTKLERRIVASERAVRNMAAMVASMGVENDRLTEQLAAREEARAAATVQAGALRQERDAEHAAYGREQALRQQYAAELVTVLDDRDDAIGGRDTALAAYAKAREVRDVAISSGDRARDAITAERDAAIAETEHVRGERSALQRHVADYAERERVALMDLAGAIEDRDRARRNERVAWGAAGDERYRGEITAVLDARDEWSRLASERLAALTEAAEALESAGVDMSELGSRDVATGVRVLTGTLLGTREQMDDIKEALSDLEALVDLHLPHYQDEEGDGPPRSDRIEQAGEEIYSLRVSVARLNELVGHRAPSGGCPARHDVTGGAVACTPPDGHDGEHRYAAPRESEAMKDAREEMEERQADASERGVENRPPSVFADLKAPANLAEIVAEVADEARAAAVERTKAYRPRLQLDCDDCDRTFDCFRGESPCRKHPEKESP